MRRYKVLCLWDLSVSPNALDGLRQVADVVVREPDRQWLLEHIHEFDVYMASLHVRLDKELLDHATNLKFVATPTTGLDHLDIAELDRRGIRWYCIKTEYELLDRVTATAEMAWALMLAAVRKVPKAYEAAMRGHWARDAFRGRQMSYKTLGILGVGRLGKMVAAYGHAFRMRVLGCDTAPRERVAGVEYVDFDTLLRESDVLSIHIHLTPENRHLINAAAFARMKDGVVIVNTSRGAIINEEDFLAALESGKVGAAGLDVIEGEWRPDLAAHPLIKYAREHDNLVIVPHLGGITYESQAMSTNFVADKVRDTVVKLAAEEHKPVPSGEQRRA